MKEQIEEMAKIVAVQRGYGCNEQDHCDMSCQVFKVGCIPHEDAQILYDAGYRKQSVGEWIKTETNYTCSTCNFNVISWSGEYDGYECQRGISLMKFCPNCGASMKGGAE